MKRLNKFLIIGGALANILAFSNGCSSFQGNYVKAPYKATAERKMRIITAKKLIKVNDTEQRVLSIAGEPDEVRTISTSLNTSAEKVGFAFIYLLKRERDHGSISQRGEENLKIIFNNRGIVTRVEANGHF